MIGHVTRSMQRLDPPVAALNHITVRQHPIRDKRAINPLATAHQPAFGQRLHDRAATGLWWAERQNRRAGFMRQGARQRRVIQMRMGYQNMRHLLSGGERAQDRLQMRLILGTGINHGNVARSQQIGVCAPKGHR